MQFTGVTGLQTDRLDTQLRGDSDDDFEVSYYGHLGDNKPFDHKYSSIFPKGEPG